MKFPSYERAIFKNNALKEVVCQIRHPRMLAIDAELPVEMQKRLQKDYPVLAHKKVFIGGSAASLQDAASVNTNVQQSLLSTNAYDFLTINSEWRIGLASDSFSLTTNVYTRWEEFRHRIRDMVEAHQECYSQSIFTRIGLRYMDVIDRHELGLGDANWSKLVRPELLGLLGSGDIKPDDIQNIDVSYLVALEKGNLTLRLYFVENAQNGNVALMLDCDFWIEENLKADIDDICKILEGFHEEAGAVFHWAITPELKDRLGPQAI